jgi:hypothetical protein
LSQRAQEILDIDPKERSERIQRQLAERIAYREIMAEERAERERSGGE